MESQSYNHPKLEDLQIDFCYLCNKPLAEPQNSDHIIPDAMFPDGAENRPQLPVHKVCNDKKTLLDERFRYRILLTTHIGSREANRDLDGFMAKVQQESQDAYLVSRNVRNLKLARTLGKGMQLQLEVLRNGQRLVQVDTGDAHVRDIKGYASKMTRGLFIRNVPNVRPKKPIIHIIDKQLYTKDRLQSIGEPVKKMIEDGFRTKSHFGQTWPGYISYFGRKADEQDAGMVLVEFYNVYWILALFEPTA